MCTYMCMGHGAAIEGILRGDREVLREGSWGEAGRKKGLWRVCGEKEKAGLLSKEGDRKEKDRGRQEECGGCRHGSAADRACVYHAWSHGFHAYHCTDHMCWHMPGILALGQQKQEDQVSLGFIVSWRPAWAPWDCLRTTKRDVFMQMLSWKLLLRIWI